MDSQKIENVLNMSLDASVEEREKSSILGVGYEEENNTWELIVKYHGDIDRYQSDEIRIENLIAGYAIVQIRENLIDAFASLEEIEFIEKPKRLATAVDNAKQASCILQVTERDPLLTGEGVLIGIIDSGIDYFNEQFRNQDGTSKVLTIWDQTIIPNSESGQNPPEGFLTGVEFSNQQINEAILRENRQTAQQVVPSIDNSGHGTAIAGIASSIAVDSELVVVKLGNPNPLSFPRTTELMRALKYVTDKALLYNRAIAINISFGNSYGPHDGTSLLERYLNNIAEVGRSSICVGSGNEGSNGGHLAITLVVGEERVIELAVAPFETGVNLQLWKNYNDVFRITLISPSGIEYQIEQNRPETIKRVMGQTNVLIYAGEPTPYSLEQEIFFDFIPMDLYVESGIWRLNIEPVSLVTGQIDLYLPVQLTRNMGTMFYRPTPEVTLTIPSTSERVITVGAYDSRLNSYADFSGRGYVNSIGNEIVITVKPEIVAPGVNIQVITTTGGTTTVSGTSFATPFVTGSAALMMEWGIVRGNDPYMYGEKLKAFLIRGARRLPGYTIWPNPQVGWGALCLRNSLPL